MKTEKFHIDFILDSVRKIEESLSGITKDVFLVNQDKQSLTILQLMLIGETSKKLQEETRNKIELPWKEIAGFRDMAIHDYVNLDLNKIWDTAQNRIPELKAKMLEYEKSKTL